MFKRKFVAAVALALVLSACLSACVGGVGRPSETSAVSDTPPSPIISATDNVTTAPVTEPSTVVTDVTTEIPADTSTPATEPPSTEPQSTEPVVPVAPVEVKTTGGVVIVGTIGYDEKGWYIQPEQPLNVSYEYFLNNPTVIEGLTRVNMFDPKDDGVEKAFYIGQTVTVEGSFRFYRDDFSTLYLTAYSITIGKTVAESYGDPDLKPKDEPQDLYDPSIPLPDKMASITKDGL